MKRIGVFLSSLLFGCTSSLLALPVTDGLVMNLEADNIPGSAVAGDGTIESWVDSSGMGNHATQTSLINKPAYIASNPDFKGYASVSFDGVNDWMGLNGNMVNVGSFTAFAVAKYDVMAGERYIIAGQPGGSGAERLRICTNSSNRFVWRAGNASDVSSVGDTDSHVFSMTSAVAAYLDGVSMGTNNNSSVLYPSGLNIGSYNRGTKAFFQGDVTALVMYNRVLSPAEIEQVNNYLANKYIVGASSPVPANGATAVGTPGVNNVSFTLQWNAAVNPDDPTKVDPKVKKHLLYLGEGETDANMVLLAELDITDYNNVTTTYGPITRPYDKTYTWRVDELTTNALGVNRPIDDPNNYKGKNWTFTTLLSVPNILSGPTSVRFDQGGATQVGITYTSVNPVTAAWYHNGQPVALDGRITATLTNSAAILNITNAQLADEGSYYCVLTSEGGSSTSLTATMMSNRLLASYEFEQNLNDSAGSNNGQAVNSPIYVEGAVGDYAIEATDGISYVLLSTNAYPKAGLGNGLDQFTYSFWAKPSSLLSGEGRIMGNFNDGSTTTGMQFGVNGNGSLRTYIRTQTNVWTQFFSPDNTIIDDVWSYVAITYNGSVMNYYVNGSMVMESSVPVLDNFEPWQYPMTILIKNSRNSFVEPYRGALDDLRIYNYALDEYQVADAYYVVTGDAPCITSMKPGIADVNGDCSVDIGDIADLATVWLQSGLYPDQN